MVCQGLAGCCPVRLLGIVVGLQLLGERRSRSVGPRAGLLVVFSVCAARSACTVNGSFRGLALLAGTAGGGIGAVFSTGVAYVIYLGHRLRDRRRCAPRCRRSSSLDGGSV